MLKLPRVAMMLTGLPLGVSTAAFDHGKGLLEGARDQMTGHDQDPATRHRHFREFPELVGGQDERLFGR